MLNFFRLLNVFGNIDVLMVILAGLEAFLEPREVVLGRLGI